MGNTPKRKATTKRPAAKKPNRRAPARTDPSEEEIRRRAYELYERRGGVPGHEHDDWTRAERELRGEP